MSHPSLSGPTELQSQTEMFEREKEKKRKWVKQVGFQKKHNTAYIFFRPFFYTQGTTIY